LRSVAISFIPLRFIDGNGQSRGDITGIVAKLPPVHESDGAAEVLVLRNLLNKMSVIFTAATGKDGLPHALCYKTTP
jgi:hypothetical protein